MQHKILDHTCSTKYSTITSCARTLNVTPDILEAVPVKHFSITYTENKEQNAEERHVMFSRSFQLNDKNDVKCLPPRAIQEPQISGQPV